MQVGELLSFPLLLFVSLFTALLDMNFLGGDFFSFLFFFFVRSSNSLCLCVCVYDRSYGGCAGSEIRVSFDACSLYPFLGYEESHLIVSDREKNVKMISVYFYPFPLLF